MPPLPPHANLLQLLSSPKPRVPSPNLSRVPQPSLSSTISLFSSLAGPPGLRTAARARSARRKSFREKFHFRSIRHAPSDVLLPSLSLPAVGSVSSFVVVGLSHDSQRRCRNAILLRTLWIPSNPRISIKPSSVTYPSPSHSFSLIASRRLSLSKVAVVIGMSNQKGADPSFFASLSLSLSLLMIV